MTEKGGCVAVVVCGMVMSSASEFDDNVRWGGDEREVDVPFESRITPESKGEAWHLHEALSTQHASVLFELHHARLCLQESASARCSQHDALDTTHDPDHSHEKYSNDRSERLKQLTTTMDLIIRRGVGHSEALFTAKNRDK